VTKERSFKIFSPAQILVPPVHDVIKLFLFAPKFALKSWYLNEAKIFFL
jgi:hypothetical protein